MTADQRRPRMLMIDVNNDVPTDRRIWLECQALAEDGFDVVVICPARSSAIRREVIDGIRIRRYATSRRTGRKLGYVVGYVVAWLQTARLLVSEWRRRPFDVVQLCNPPDTYFPLAALARVLGAKFLFDQHDLCPEIYHDRFGGRRGVIPYTLLALERWTHRVADHVITVNDSCRDLLLSRTSTAPDRLTVVSTGPDFDRLRRGPAVAELRQGRRFLCSYLGVMGPQDCVDTLLEAIAVMVHDLGRQDVHFVLMGDGDQRPALVELARSLAIEPWVTFTGFADDDTISSYLSTSDLGLQPDRRTAFTDLCTMLKTVEYMAFGLPVVAFPLLETRRAAGPAAYFVDDESPLAFALAIIALLDDPELRARMGRSAEHRVRERLAWTHWKPIYVDVVRTLAIMAPAAEAPDTRRRTGTARPRSIA